MRKSDERIALETEIRKTHEEAKEIALKMIKEEWGFTESDDIPEDELLEVIRDPGFIDRMNIELVTLRTHYNDCYRRLEVLEQKEDHWGMRKYAMMLDQIADLLPCREFCHYPYSGVDFYWARIFNRIVFEDLAFDGMDHEELWWEKKAYSHDNRVYIVNLMRGIGIIPQTAEMEFLFTDAENSNVGNDFNNPRTTLLVKGGHDILGYLERRFRKKKLEYGVILAADVANPRPELIEGMCHRGYTLTGAVEGTGVIAPFSMELRNVYIFQKGRHPIIR